MDLSSQPPPPTTDPVPHPAPPEAAARRGAGGSGERTWSWWAGPAGLLGAFLGASILGAVIIGVASLAGADISTSDGFDAPGGIVMLTLVAQDACFIVAPILLAGLFFKPVRPWHFGLRRPTVSWLKAVGWIVVLYVVFLGLSALWQQVVDVSQESQVTDDLGVKANDAAAIAGAFLTCVLAPIAEELLFRGFLFTTLRNRMGIIAGGVVTGVLFGAIHLGSAPDAALPILMLLGALLCWLYVVTGSLVPAIIAHALNNAVAYGSILDWGWQIPVVFVVSLGILLVAFRGIERRFGLAPPAAAAA